MPELRLGGKRTDLKPDRVGIKLADPTSAPRLGGKLSAYVPAGAQYDYKPPSVFARYKVLTGVFVALALSLMSYWVFVSRQPRAAAAAPPAPVGSAPPAPQDQPVYIEPLPSK
jgi:hypothetical protein